MIDRIEHRHDLSVDLESLGYVHGAAHHPADAGAHRALAVPRRPVEKHRAAHTDGRPELVEYFVLDDEMLEG